jgi:hypothetical protein
MVGNALWIARKTSRERIPSLCVFMTLLVVSHGVPEVGAQKQDSRREWIRNEQCEEALRQPLTTLDLNGDGVCNEIDVYLNPASFIFEKNG